jgi:hypothetical protein
LEGENSDDYWNALIDGESTLLPRLYSPGMAWELRYRAVSLSDDGGADVAGILGTTGGNQASH